MEIVISMIDNLCEAIPFLRQLPPDLRRSIDTTTLYVPDRAIAETRAELEDKLGCHIMTYRTVPLVTSVHKGLHLCRLLVPASLTRTQLEEIEWAEGACRDKGVVFVAYMKPLQLRESPENEHLLELT
ncbi:MAG TPA: hypothetical protein VHO84_04870 [Syntrophorhabdaceae bacterium]|nr:hypothetical protein [Syntrophorhabdaceae bacterium]